MMNELQIFSNDTFGQIRTVDVNGKIYFVASDVARALKYQNTTKAISDHCKGVTKRYILTNGGKQSVNVIPEPDIYRLVTHSKLPAAEKFERWIFEEVLPTVRKTGSYQMQPEQPQPVTLKFYNTTRVITKLDARDLLGVSENVIQYALYNKKVGCIKNQDFWVLKHSELRKYIADNNPIRRTVSALIIITENGFNKIRDFLKILNAMPFPSQTLPSTSPTRQVLPIQTTNLLRHETLPADVLLQFDKTKKALIALDVALDVYKLPSNFRKKSQNGIDALQNLAANVLVQTNQILCSYDHLQIQS